MQIRKFAKHERSRAKAWQTAAANSDRHSILLARKFLVEHGLAVAGLHSHVCQQPADARQLEKVDEIGRPLEAVALRVGIARRAGRLRGVARELLQYVQPREVRVDHGARQHEQRVRFAQRQLELRRLQRGQRDARRAQHAGSEPARACSPRALR